MATQEKVGMTECAEAAVAGAHRGGSSRFRGVSWKSDQKKWMVQIQCKGKRRHVWLFDDEVAAAKAYDEAARKLHGTFARLNFPDDPDAKRVLAPPGMIDRHEARRMFGVGLKTWERWEREGVMTCGKIIYLPSGGRQKVYPRAEIERLVEESGRISPPYPDPDRPRCYRVPLTGREIKRREAIIDAASLPLVAGRAWCWCEGSSEGKGMVIQARRGETTPLRRIIMGVVGTPADEVQVSHINGDPLDCRRENLVLRTITLRLASARKRKTHHGKPCTSQYKGVSSVSNQNKWRAQIHAEGKTHHLGVFFSEIDAAEAYDEAARKFFGEHAWLNFPDEGECGVAGGPTTASAKTQSMRVAA